MVGKTVKVIYRDNGVGLTRDASLVTELLHNNGIKVYHTDPDIGPSVPRDFGFDLAIHLEIVGGKHYTSANKHVLIPNQEWFFWPHVAGRFDKTFCKTKHAMEIFTKLGFNCAFTSFTSKNRFNGTKFKDKEHAFLHLAGRSRLKNTDSVIRAWNSHPEWPTLYLFNMYEDLTEKITGGNIVYRFGELEEEELIGIQNRILFSIMPSAAEGFGHVLWEQMSTGSINITTDAPPMNEGCADIPFLCEAIRLKKHGLDYVYGIKQESLEANIELVLSLSPHQLGLLSRLSRMTFIENDLFFRETFIKNIKDLLED